MAIKISLVAPAHNEVGNLPEFIKKTVAALKKITSDFEIIIVDDGSIDDSFKILKKIKLSKLFVFAAALAKPPL